MSGYNNFVYRYGHDLFKKVVAIEYEINGSFRK